MKQEPRAFEEYPFSTVLITNSVALLVWVISVYLVWQLGRLWGMLFAVYLIFHEFSIYKGGCSSCYYYGKRCAFNRGKIAPLLVKKQDARKFCEKLVDFKSLLPVLLGSFIPVAVGIYLLVQNFDYLILACVLILIANWFVVNPLMFGKLVCLHCKQGRLCCPANDFFNKKKE